MGLLSRIWGGLQGKTVPEGAFRPPPYLLSDGWLGTSAGRLVNWWQAGYLPQPYGEPSAMVEACVSAYAQTAAMCPGDHWRRLSNGGRERISTSALSRVIKRPNDYQSGSDFLLNLTRRLYSNGEAFALAVRNDRFEISELHLMRYGFPLIGEDGSIFYQLSGNQIAERRFDNLAVPRPARDVLHVRLHTPRHPLKGESPILAATLDLAMSGAALNQQVAFYLNQARPSFMLETDEKLTQQQMRELRNYWNEQTQGDNAGGTPILSWGLKARDVSTTAKDGDLAALLKMTDQNVALTFRIPLQVLGVGDTPFASTEALMSAWKASGLGFGLNHIEEAYGLLFGLRGWPDEYLELDTSALLRSNFKDQIEGLAAGVKGGIYAVNDARAVVELPSVEGGDEPRVQQQDVPLSAWKPAPPASPAPASPPAPPAPPAPKGDPPNADGSRRAFANLVIAAADRHDERRLAA